MAGATEAFTSAGTTYAISAALPATLTKTAYAALSWTPIAEVTDGGETGRTYRKVTHQPLGSRGDVQLKGGYSDGDKVLQAAYAPGDPGQALLATALDDDDFYSIRETLQDGTIKYMQAQVFSAPVKVGGVDSVTSTTFNLGIKSGSIVTALPA